MSYLEDIVSCLWVHAIVWMLIPNSYSKLSRTEMSRIEHFFESHPQEKEE